MWNRQRPDVQESEQSVHTSRVTWTIWFGHKGVSLPYACFTEEQEKDQSYQGTLKESLTPKQFHQSGCLMVSKNSSHLPEPTKHVDIVDFQG